MNKKSFFWGMVVGFVLGVITFFIIGLCLMQSNQTTVDAAATETSQNSASDPVHYFDEPQSYENKSETSFKVLQVLSENAALADEVSKPKYDIYTGNTVVIVSENCYTGQVISVKNPQIIGTYSYTNRAEIPMTVPVIKGE